MTRSSSLGSGPAADAGDHPTGDAANAPDPTRRSRRQLGAARELLEQLALHTGVSATRRLRHADAVRVGARLGAFYGAATRRIASRDHRVAVRNLALAFPSSSDAERDAIRAAMWRNWGRALIEVARMGSLDPATLRDIVRLDPVDGPAEIFARARVKPARSC